MQLDPSLYQAFGLLGPVTPDHFQLSISAPGPQYLYLLEICLEGFLRKLEDGVDVGVMPKLEFLFFMRRFEYRPVLHREQGPNSCLSTRALSAGAGVVLWPRFCQDRR